MKGLLQALRLPLFTLILLLLILSAPSILYRTAEALRIDPAAPFTLLKQMIGELAHGEFLRYTAGKTGHSILNVLPDALLISGLFLLAAGCVSIFSALVLALLLPASGSIWREISGLLSVIPDFMLVLLLQIGVVVIARTTGISVARTAWTASSKPALLLPLISLSLLAAVYLMRIAVSERTKIASQPYIRFARARGIGERPILLRHILPGIVSAFRSELLKALSIILGNLFIVEHLFNIPGITRFMFRYVFIADNDYFSYSRSLVTQIDVGLISLGSVMLLFLAVYLSLRGLLSLVLKGVQS